MSSNIASIKAAHFKAAENKRHNMEMKKLRLENSRKYREAVNKHETMMKNLNQNYETKTNNMNNDLKRKVSKIRVMQQESMAQENSRLDSELHDLKKAHQDQVAELKISQRNEIKDLSESHQRTLKNMEQKFINEKVKYDR